MNVLIDTDPGGDDAIALLWLASLVHQGRVKLVGVSTAAGNVGAGTTFRNAAGILALCRLNDVPIGIAPPGLAPRDATEVHGEDGLGGLADELPEPSLSYGPAAQSATLILECLERHEDAPYVLAVAPLSNLASAEAAAPGTLGRARDLIVMGGSLGQGNITRSAEFNFYCDPASAAKVLSARRETRLVTLDTSQSLRLTDRISADIVAGFAGCPAASFFSRLCRFMSERDAHHTGHGPAAGFPVHDAATVAWLVYPELFESRRCRVAIETADGELRGRLRETDDPESAACRVASAVAADALLEKMALDLKDLFAGL